MNDNYFILIFVDCYNRITSELIQKCSVHIFENFMQIFLGYFAKHVLLFLFLFSAVCFTGHEEHLVC